MKKYQKGGGVTNPGVSDRRGVRPKLTEKERIKKEVEARKKKAESLGKGAIPTSRRRKRYDELSPQERKKREIEAKKKRSKEFGKGVKMKENTRPGTRPGRMQKGRGKLPKAQKGQVVGGAKKVADRIKRGPGILPPSFLDKGKLKKEWVKGSGIGPTLVTADINSFKKKAKGIRDKMQKGGSLRRSRKHK